jgi:hypothetical protein
MKDFVLTPPKIGFIVATRAALAFGVGLLVSRKLSDRRRRRLGAALIGFGAATTVPAALLLRRSRRRVWFG